MDVSGKIGISGLLFFGNQPCTQIVPSPSSTDFRHSGHLSLPWATRCTMGAGTPAGCCGESLGHWVTAKYLRKVGERTLVTFCNGSLTSKMNTSKMKWFTRYLTILFFTFFGEPFQMEVELDEFGKVQRYKSRVGSNLSVKNSGRGTHGQCLMLLLNWKIGEDAMQHFELHLGDKDGILNP